MPKKDAVLTVRMDAKLYHKISTACGNQRISVSDAARLLFTAWLCNGGKPQTPFPYGHRILRGRYLEYLRQLYRVFDK